MRKATWEELSQRHFELPKNNIKMDPRFKYGGGNYYYRDTVYKDDNGKWHGDKISDFELELFKIREELDEFADEYGLEVVSLRNKEVQQSEEMQKAYDRITKAKREGEARKTEAEYAKDVALKEAETMKIRQEAYNSQFISLMKNLKESGYSTEDAIRMAQTLMITNGNNGNNIPGATAQTMAGVAAGQVAANEIRNDNKQKSK